MSTFSDLESNGYPAMQRARHVAPSSQQQDCSGIAPDSLLLHRRTQRRTPSFWTIFSFCHHSTCFISNARKSNDKCHYRDETLLAILKDKVKRRWDIMIKLNAYQLKWIAIVGMFLSHVVASWWAIVPEALRFPFWAAGMLY